MISKSFYKTDIFLVTGASSGIGKAVALELNKKGAFVVPIGRNRNRLEELEQEIEDPARCRIVEKDLSTEACQDYKFVSILAKEVGKFRGLVLSAGIQDIRPLRISKQKDVKKLFDINFHSGFFLSQAFCDKRVNVGQGSSIVFLSSIASLIGSPGISAYSASKGAINALVQSMAVEVARQGIRVNAVLPGFVKSEMTDFWNSVYTQDYIAKLEEKYPLGIGQVEDIVGPILFLLSDLSRWITGTTLVVDGGGRFAQ